MDFVHLHFALEWLSWAFKFHFLIWKCFFIKMEKEARYCKREHYLFFLRSIRFDIVAEMICCMYLKWFEWATWLSLSVIYYVSLALVNLFPNFAQDGLLPNSELPQQLLPPSKKGGHWERCPLGISANHEPLEGAEGPNLCPPRQHPNKINQAFEMTSLRSSYNPPFFP